MKWLDVVAIILIAFFPMCGLAQTVEPVRFPGPDGIELTGYLFRPEHPEKAAAAVVMLHGRAGPYSTAASADRLDASALSRRHKFWGALWSNQGYFALLVDSFGPRGHRGFPAHSYGDRPEAVNEVTVRPFDAYAALAYLQKRAEIDPRRVALQGWSNGGSAALATMADRTRNAAHPVGPPFKAALIFYPACGLHDAFRDGYRPYAPVKIFSGDADEEVSAERCVRFVQAAHSDDLDIVVYPDATHDFDDPSPRHQSDPANAQATDNAVTRAKLFLGAMFRSERSH